MIRILKHALGWFAAISFAVAIYDMVTGGFHLTIAGIRVSSVEAYKPFRNGIICACVALWLRDRQAGDNTWWERLARWSAPLAVCAAGIAALVAIRFGIFVAGGSDAYGYVSQASLWSAGQLLVQEPLAPIGRALGIITAPLGYRPAIVAGASVPTYAPGYPILMALAMKVAGESAAFFVVPVCAAIIVVLTYMVGARFAGPRTGFLAALFMACSPIFIFQSLEPMSDVPVTMWFLLAWWLLLSDRTVATAAAGLATSAAILTRPNLAPLAGVLTLVAARGRPRIGRGVLFVLGTLPGVLAIAAINRHLYGTVSMSGYGSLRELFDLNNLVPNLQRYPVWLVQLHTPAILLSLLAPFVATREPDADEPIANPRSTAILLSLTAPSVATSESDADEAIANPRRTAVWMIVFGIVLLLSYLFYGVFEDWPYLRFLLPAIPLLIVLSCNVFVAALLRLPLAIRSAAMFAVCVLLGTWFLKKSDQLGVYAISLSERRYESVGRFLDHALPANAAIITVIESGSARMYGKRATLRWDEVPAGKLDHTLDALRAGGYTPYILLEDWERSMFRDRFKSDDLAGLVDWPAAIEYYGPVTVKIYNPDDRKRYVAGERWLPRIVPRM